MIIKPWKLGMLGFLGTPIVFPAVIAFSTSATIPTCGCQPSQPYADFDHTYHEANSTLVVEHGGGDNFTRENTRELGG